MDSLQTNIDTVIHKIIYNEDIYKTILTEQHETYEFLLYSFLGIMGLFLGASLFLNFWYFQNKIESTVNGKILDLESKINSNSNKLINSNFDDKINPKMKSIEEEFLKIREDIDKTSIHFQGSLLHLQGNRRLFQSDFEGAFLDFVSAVKCYSDCGEKANLIRILKIITDILPKLHKGNITKLEKYFDINIEEIVDDLKSIDEKGELSDNIFLLNIGYNEARERIPQNKK